MNDKGFKVAAYNRTVAKVAHFAEHEAAGTQIRCCTTLEDFIGSLKAPRRVMLMVKAGSAVDDFIALLEPHLSAGDIIIDGGNSQWTDTARRCASLESRGLLFVGCGVSGGEEGARHGPSLMPGGSPAAWPHLQPIFQGIAAKTTTEKGEAVTCCQWIGPGGSGHFVKTVHNGIEYADMQALCEGYQLLRRSLSAGEIADVLAGWRKTPLDCYLLEITVDILKYKDADGSFLVDKIKDAAQQKGTGKWTVLAALDEGVPGTLFSEAVFFRALSSQQEARLENAKILPGVQSATYTPDATALWHALYCAKIMAYAQGFALIQQQSTAQGWSLNLPGICEAWMGGCIIRSRLLEPIREALKVQSSRPSFLHDAYFVKTLADFQGDWRSVVAGAVSAGVSVGALATALSYYDALRTARSPANLLQAQRDYFGAHTYERLDDPGIFHHTNWTGRGGNVSSTNYNV